MQEWHNVVWFGMDSGVVISTQTAGLKGHYRGMFKIVDPDSDPCPPGLEGLRSDSDYGYFLPITMPGMHSIEDDSILGNFHLQLSLKGDTMDLIIRNVFINDSNLVAYVIGRIPFLRGNFTLSLPRVSSVSEYANYYADLKESRELKSVLTCGWIYSYDITPVNWEDLRTDR